MRPAQRRAAVQYVPARFARSQRRAGRLVGGARATSRDRSRRGDDAVLRTRLRERADQRPHFGYRRLPVLSRWEGRIVNHKRVARLYRAEGLAGRRRTRKSPVRLHRGRPPAPRGANQ